MAELATVARPYAKALFGVALEQNKLEPWLAQLQTLALLAEDPKVASVLDAPEQGAENRVKVLTDLAPEAFADEQVKNFVQVLADNGRLAVLPAIFEQYQIFALEHSNIQEATVYSAFAMNDEEFAKVVADLQTHFDTKLKANLVVDPELIGGIKVEVGDQVLDMSIQGRLKTLYATMIN